VKIKTGDEVEILLGKDKGKKGKVEKAFPSLGMVIVGGLNIYKKHKKPQGKTMQGGIIDITKPINVANVSLVCPKCKLPAKVGYKLGDKNKERVCKKCNQIIG
jgi:large subunit ribosomal protein L24